MNQELTAIHQEVITNLESIHGALLRMNRSIQAEGTFGIIKWDKSYRRLFRRGQRNVIFELTMIFSAPKNMNPFKTLLFFAYQIFNLDFCPKIRRPDKLRSLSILIDTKRSLGIIIDVNNITCFY